MAKHEDDYQTIFVKANKEFRLIINELPEEVSLELLHGDAEIFGVDMLSKQIYTFSSSIAVFTRQGCTLKLEGHPARMYSASKNSAIDNIHSKLEDYRTRAERKKTLGPITLITGPTDVGKSTLTRTLINWAARSGRKPLYFDLDVGQSNISIPGTLGVLPIDGPEDLVKGFNDNNLSVYYFGYKSPGMNIALYFLLIQKLGETLRYRMTNSNNVNHSGAIIDTCGWVEGQGYQSIMVAARSFEVSLLIVLSDTRLYSQLKHDLPSNVEVRFLPKLEGVVERSKSVRRSRRDNLVEEYFYGTAQHSFITYSIKLKFSEVQIVQVTSSTSKISIDRLDEVRRCVSVVKVPISNRLLNHVLAVSHADNIEDAMLTSVLGFICIVNIDMESGVLTALSPQPSLSSKRVLVMGDIQFNPIPS